MSSEQKQQQVQQGGVQLQQSKVFNRVVSYPLVSNLFNRTIEIYESAKSYNQYVKTGLESAENIAVKAAVVVAPILSKVDLDNRVDSALDSVEKTTGIVYNNTKNIVSTARRTVTQPLDVVIETVNKYLPEEKVVAADGKEEPKQQQQQDQQAVVPSAPLSSSQKLGVISSKVRKAAWTKLKDLKLRNEKLSDVVDLIEYAKEHLDKYASDFTHKAEEYREKAEEFGESVKVRAEQAVDKVITSETKKKINQALEPVLGNIKDSTTKAIVVTLSTVGAVVDIASQQIKFAYHYDYVSALKTYSQIVSLAVANWTAAATEKAGKSMLALHDILNKLSNEIRNLKDDPVKYVESWKVIFDLQSKLRQVLSGLGINLPLLGGSPSPAANNHQQLLQEKKNL